MHSQGDGGIGAFADEFVAYLVVFANLPAA